MSIVEAPHMSLVIAWRTTKLIEGGHRGPQAYRPICYYFYVFLRFFFKIQKTWLFTFFCRASYVFSKMVVSCAISHYYNQAKRKKNRDPYRDIEHLVNVWLVCSDAQWHGFVALATEHFPSWRQEHGAVCRRKWRHHEPYQHLRLNCAEADGDPQNIGIRGTIQYFRRCKQISIRLSTVSKNVTSYGHFALNSVLRRYVWSSEAWLLKLGYTLKLVVNDVGELQTEKNSCGIARFPCDSKVVFLYTV